MYDRGTMTSFFSPRSSQSSARRSRLRAAVGAGLLTVLVALAIAPRAGAQARGPVLQLETLRRDGRTYVVRTDDGGQAQLTLDPRMQEPIEDVLRVFQI